MIYLLVRNKIISHSVNKSEIHSALSEIPSVYVVISYNYLKLTRLCRSAGIEDLHMYNNDMHEQDAILIMQC